MNVLAALFAADRLLEALVHTALAATAVAAATLLALLTARRAHAAARVALALAGLTVLAATPLLALAARGTPFGLSLLAVETNFGNATQPQVEATPGEPASPQQAQALATAPVQTAVAPPAVAAADRAAPARTWSLGSVLLLCWLCASTLQFWRELRAGARIATLRARCRELAGPRLHTAAAAAARDLGLRAAPLLLSSRDLPCPATIGIIRPVVVLPEPLLANAAPATVAALVRHELAHIALGHPRQGLLQCLVRVLFCWHPLARAVAHALGAAQEEVADNAALRGGAEPLAYARALVAIAGAALRMPPAPQALFARGGHPFSRRIERLARKDPDTMIHPTPWSRALAGSVAAAAMLLPFAVRLLPAQAPPGPQQAKDGAHSAAAFMPLQEGTQWTWRVQRTYQDGTNHDQQEQAVVWGDVPLGEHGTCAQILAGEQCEYWSADERGIFQHHNEYLGGLRGVDSKRRTRLLAAPVGAETRWEWDEMLTYQTIGDPAPRDPEDDRVHHQAELLGVDDEVKVPAGTFRCAHVRITATNRNWTAPHKSDLWFGRGAGRVREQETGDGGTMLRELTAFTPGKPVARDPAAALGAFVAAQFPAATPAPQVEWLPGDEWAFYLRGRFAIVRPAAGEARAVWVDAAAQAFTPTDKAFWAARVAELRTAPPAAAVPQGAQQVARMADPGLGHLAQALARIEGLRRGFAGFESRGSQSEQQLGAKQSETCTVRLAAKDVAGQRLRVTAVMKTVGDDLTEVSVEVGPEPGPQQAGQQKELDPRVPPPPLPLPPRRG